MTIEMLQAVGSQTWNNACCGDTYSTVLHAYEDFIWAKFSAIGGTWCKGNTGDYTID